MSTDAKLKHRLFAWIQLCLPTRFLSWCMYLVTRIEAVWFKNAFIRRFMKDFGISLAEAEFETPERYRSFNHFFTRALKPGARPLPSDPAIIVSPVDGTVSELGDIRDGRIVQAKGFDYSLVELLGGDTQWASAFAGGTFCTIYLAPYNYHRIHMPLAGTLRDWMYVPGRLFSVNQATARAMPRLFTRNERVIAMFDTSVGPFALIMVGALFVGSIETVWSGQVTPPHSRKGIGKYRPTQPTHLDRGAECGRFNMGSTVILLTAPGAVQWAKELVPSRALRMGEAIGRPRA